MENINDDIFKTGETWLTWVAIPCQ